MNSKIREAMTIKEVKYKAELIDLLKNDGFYTFGKYLENFHVNIVDSREVGKPFVAAISPKLGVVYVNPSMTGAAVSMVLRHEIAHQVFKHNEHLIAKLKAMGIDTPSEAAHRLGNITGDYHISNQIYDAADRRIAKALRIEMPDGSKKDFPGLVTEFDFPENPEYWTMEFDDLFDIFVKDYDPEILNAKAAQQSKEEKRQDEPSVDYITAWNEVMDAYTKGEISMDDLKDLAMEMTKRSIAMEED